MAAKKKSSNSDKDLRNNYKRKQDVPVVSSTFGPSGFVSQAEARKMTGAKSYKKKIVRVDVSPASRGQVGSVAKFAQTKAPKTEMSRAAGKLTPNKPKQRGGSTKKK